MNPMCRRLRKVALGFFIVAAIAFLTAYSFGHRYRWIALEEPIRLEEGFALSRAFTVDAATDYYIAVQCRRAIPLEKLTRALKEELAAECTVLENGRDIVDGDPRYSEYGGSFISQGIGRFDGIPGRLYTLTLQVSRSLPALAPTQPTVEVRVHPVFSKGWFVLGMLCFQLAVALAFASLICFGTSFLFKRQPVVG